MSFFTNASPKSKEQMRGDPKGTKTSILPFIIVKLPSMGSLMVGGRNLLLFVY